MRADSNEKQAFWRGKLQEYRQSGLNRREFCERNRIKKSRLDYWFRRLRKPAASKGLVELKISAQAQSSALEVIVGDRYRIAISSGFDSRLLGELVLALESLA